MAIETYDLVVIGAGPGGYVAAIRAAQLGLRTALIEREDLGGVCLNRGCIPSKAMLRSAEILGLVRTAGEYGVRADNVDLDYAAVVARRDLAVAHLLQGVTNLLRGNGVTVVGGAARVRDGGTIEVGSAEPGLVGFRNVVVATGSRAAALPVPGADLPGVIDSDAALGLERPPQRAVIVGGGAVGVEWAEIWRAFGSEVTVLEMLPQLVPTEEPEIARELARAFAQKGIAVHAGARVSEVRTGADGLEVLAAVGDTQHAFSTDIVLGAVGRRPNLEALNLEAVGVEHDEKGIPTDSHMRTNVPSVYAVGDVTGRYLLAHVASHQGIVAAEAIAGRNGHEFDAGIVPAAIFTHPEVASVGLREHQAREQGLAVRTARFPFSALGRGHASGEPGGFVKIVAREDSGRIEGVHIVGPNAGDLIGEACLAMRLNATLGDLAATIHVHPTFSEALMEAAHLALGLPIHVPRRAARG